MLDLQRASAGSGKTYTLAKKYIWYFITIRDQDDSQPGGLAPARLRKKGELADSARHILAVTFTNKATNEMQMRIVRSLYNLAWPPSPKKRGRDGKPRNPDYMDEFCQTLGVSEAELSALCRDALGVLLDNYSQFNVSTIDSFFQNVLRTFAYESEINDTFQLELDSEFLSEVGIGAMLDDLEEDRHSNSMFWVKLLVGNTKGSKWNIFRKARRTSNREQDNPYENLVKALGYLENEQYKRIRADVEAYLAANPDFTPVFTDLCNRYETPVRDAFKTLVEKARRICALFPDEIKTSRAQTKRKAFILARRIAEGEEGLKWDAFPFGKEPKFQALPPEYLNHKEVEPLVAAIRAQTGADLPREMEELSALFDSWSALVNDAAFRHWKLYSVNMPYFGLFSVLNAKRREYLTENNAVELGETSMILREVIGKSDTPFVYERLGTRLNHFLIDEFQDTSAMQWEVLAPLVSESLGHGYDNLIIGDAKQSIYRFRNADPSLITSVVPAQFKGMGVNLLGNSPGQNRNYRTKPAVVRFNNSLFSYAVAKIEERIDSCGETGRYDYKGLYANVAQEPDRTDPDGYVEIKVLATGSTAGAMVIPPMVPELVHSLVSRGYRQGDIAVLVNRNDEASSIVAAMDAWNAGRSPEEKLRYVSEKSLKVASARSVGILVGVLENIARGRIPEVNPEEERSRKGVGNWNDMRTAFGLFASDRANKGIPVADLVDKFLADPGASGSVSELLGGMQSLSIPALVEAATGIFIDPGLRRRETPYIAAFQDLVLEYCDNHPTDIASFLKWWKRKGAVASIGAPDKIDSVGILTIHKSKGLEYDCVIVPFADWNFADRLPSATKGEWRWVKPQCIQSRYPLPPYIPVNVGDAMEGTGHEPLLTDYFDKVKMETLNMAYVALTRAKSELYVFAAVPAKALPVVTAPDDATPARARKSSRKSTAAGAAKGDIKSDFWFGSMVTAFFNEGAYCGTDPGLFLSDTELSCSRSTIKYEEENPYTGIVVSKEAGVLTAIAGSKPERVQSRRSEEGLPISDYRGVAVPSFLTYQNPKQPTVNDGDDPDPRSEGNLKHAILERVEKASDLRNAVRHLETGGFLTPARARVYEAELAAALRAPNVRRWFDGSARVLNERSIILGREFISDNDRRTGRITKRPDRLMLFPDGHAEVVDYKFGQVELPKYRNQVGEYISLLRMTGRFKSVEGFIWYVTLGKVVKI